MATYSGIHKLWYTNAFLSSVRSGGIWRIPTTFIRSGGAWIPATDVSGYPAVTGPRILVRSGGLWVAETYDVWEISVCRTTPGTSTNEYTIPSSIFGLSVNKVIVSAVVPPRMWSKQYGGGVAFTHALTKNGSNVYALTGKVDDGFTCADNNWTYRGTFTGGITYVPGNTIGARVTVPNTFGNDYGGTRIELYMRWYFN